MGGGLVIYPEHEELFEKLTNRELREIIRAMLAVHHGRDDTTVTSKRLGLVWPSIRRQVEENRRKYDDRCKAMSQNGKRGGRGRKLDKAKESNCFTDKARESQKSQLEQEQEREREVSNDTGTAASAVQDTLSVLKDDASKDSILFDRKAGEIRGVTEADAEKWRRAYPLVNVESETAKAGLWLSENPSRRKKDVRKFLGAWLRTAQGDAERRGQRTEGGGRRSSAQQPSAGSFLNRNPDAGGLGKLLEV